MEGVKVAVVGAGPAGSSAAVQLSKEGLDFVLYEKDSVGGLLRYANYMDNLLGHRGINGSDMCSLIEDHLKGMNIEVTRSEVVNIRLENSEFLILAKGETKRFTHVILAAGSIPNRLDIPGCLYYIENPLIYNSRRILIIGGGDLAYDNALRLSNNGADVTIMVRNRSSANSGLIRKARDAGIDVISGDPEDIDLIGGKYSLPDGSSFDHCAAFIGRTPNTGLIDDLGDIGIDRLTGKTSVKGLYVIGDAALGTMSQAALASGMGLVAAMDIARLVRNG
ncbi:MAG: NAD(P)/FAD-dependent oxidoreductase [Thermoplasmatota archaeon]